HSFPTRRSSDLAGGGDLPQARHCRQHLLPLEVEVWRDGCQRGAAAQGAGGRERQAQAPAGGETAGDHGDEGRAVAKVVKPAARRQVVSVMRAHGLSMRRSCGLAMISRSSMYYVSRRPDDTKLRNRMRELAAKHTRWGYLFLHEKLRGEGLVVNRKRSYRIYREEGLQVR